ncbi:MAG: polyphosphate kinase 2 family protein [Mycobacterium sp.]|nr:polyphosphate kinase 2 family protein [Mycobacterium sp.]
MIEGQRIQSASTPVGHDLGWQALTDAALVAPGSHVNLMRDHNPGRHEPGLAKDSGESALAEAKLVLQDLQDRFFAQADRALLVVFQAIDAAGKDGTIKHVMSGLNPEGVDVYSFKKPTPSESAHDYLWRHQRVLPERGRIAVFNRSHYEDVLVTRVHPELLYPPVPAHDLNDLWHSRFREINQWERHLHDNGTIIVKLFLNLSKYEQKRRFLQRLENPQKNWKFSADDLAERAFWDDYQYAFQEMLTHTSTAWAPWYVIPADHKWFSHLSTSAVLVQTLRAMNPHYPELDTAAKTIMAQAKSALESEPD